MRSYDTKIAVLLWMLALGLAGSPLVAQNTAIPNAGVAAVLRGRFEYRPEFPHYLLMVMKVVSIQKGGVRSSIPPIPPRQGPGRELERE